MKKPRRTIIFIYIITVLAFVLSLPENIPLKFHVGKFTVERIINPPRINIPFLGINKVITNHLGLDLLGGLQLVLEADMKDITPQSRDRALESAKEVIDRRVNFFGVSEPMIQSAKAGDSYRIIVELPGLTNTDEAIAQIGQTAQLEFREPVDSSSSGYFLTTQNTKATGLSGKDLKKAELSFDPKTGEPGVSFELTDEGGKKFAGLTTRLVGKQLAIFLDNSIISAPTVNTPITNGQGVISGRYTAAEAKQFAATLSAGALPTPIKIVEQRTIGATLGAKSVEKSIRAGLLGLGLVLVFMMIHYGFLGFLADSALIIYGLITFAIFRLVPVTLTLPGIAGFILSIGMAVDSNILIFERFKEELRKGKPWHIAMELGFGKAWDSIRDANITTILTALILYNPLNFPMIPSSGVVRGFALTLLIGVVISLFTGLIVSRNLIRMLYPYWLAIKHKMGRRKSFGGSV